MTRVQLNARIPPAVLRLAEARAAAEGLTLTQVVVAALADYGNQLPSAPPGHAYPEVLTPEDGPDAGWVLLVRSIYDHPRDHPAARLVQRYVMVRWSPADAAAFARAVLAAAAVPTGTTTG